MRVAIENRVFDDLVICIIIITDLEWLMRNGQSQVIIFNDQNKKAKMNKTNNYDTKSSLLSIECKDYKIPYDLADGSQIVEHLEESQEQLQFLKIKLSQAYQKLERQIKNNIELNQNYEQVALQVKLFKNNWDMEQKENKKLRQVMDTMLKNRRMLEEEVQYLHKKYRKIIDQQEKQYQAELQELQKKVKKLKKENQLLEEELQNKNKQRSVSKSQKEYERDKKLQQKIQVLQNQIKKLTDEKVTEVKRLRHQIQCYKEKSVSPMRKSFVENHSTYRPSHVEYFDAESNIQNSNINSNLMQPNSVHHSNKTQSKKVSDSKRDDDSISKWQKTKIISNELSEDQLLTKAQMEKKRIQNQLIKIERLKRHTPEDRQAMAGLEKKIYELNSEISCLKRKIRQKY